MPGKIIRDKKSLIIMSAIISKGYRFLPHHLFVDINFTAGE